MMMQSEADVHETVKIFVLLLRDLTVNSKPHINRLTIFAGKNLCHAEAIANAVDDHLRKVPRVVKLPILYLIDSIMKNVGRDYITFFSRIIARSFASVFREADLKTRQQMCKLRQTWSNVVCRKVLCTLDFQVGAMDSDWHLDGVSSSTKPPSFKILVNPKFLSTPLLANSSLEKEEVRVENNDDKAEANEDNSREISIQEKLPAPEEIQKLPEEISQNMNLAEVDESTLTEEELRKELLLQKKIRELNAVTLQNTSGETPKKTIHVIDLVKNHEDTEETEASLREELLLQKRIKELLKKAIPDIAPGKKKPDIVDNEINSSIQADSTTVVESPPLLTQQEGKQIENHDTFIPPSDLHEGFPQDNQISGKLINSLANLITEQNLHFSYEARDSTHVGSTKFNRRKRPSGRYCKRRCGSSLADRKQFNSRHDDSKKRPYDKHLGTFSKKRGESYTYDLGMGQERSKLGPLYSSDPRNYHNIYSPVPVPMRRENEPCQRFFCAKNTETLRKGGFDRSELRAPLPGEEPGPVIADSGDTVSTALESRVLGEFSSKMSHLGSWPDISHSNKSLEEHQINSTLKETLLPTPLSENFPVSTRALKRQRFGQSYGKSLCKVFKDNNQCLLSHITEHRRKIPLLPLPIDPPVQFVSSQLDHDCPPNQSADWLEGQTLGLPNNKMQKWPKKIIKPSRRTSDRRISLPPANQFTLDQLFLDTSKTIAIDGLAREVRFYGEIAVILLNDCNPREISFHPGESYVVINNVIIHCEFHKPEKEVTIQGKVFRVHLGAPTRELYVNDEGFQCPFNCAPIEVQLSTGERLWVQLQASALPLVQIGPQRHDLVPGHVMLSIDKEHSLRISLDAKPQRFDIDGVPHVLRFADALETILINDCVINIQFGGPPIYFVINGKKHSLHLSELPPGIVPGDVNIINMIHVKKNSAQELFFPSKNCNQLLTNNKQLDHNSVSSSDTPISSTNSKGYPNFLPNVDIHDLYRSLCDSGLLIPQMASPDVQDCPLKLEDAIPKIHLVDFQDSSSLKIKQPGVIQVLYSGIQCSSCGIRFHADQTTIYKDHLDWHFQKNHHDKGLTRHQGRMWYHTTCAWTQLGVDSDDTVTVECQEPEMENMPSIPCHDYPEGTVCGMCQEKFQEFFNEDMDEWHLKNCISRHGMSYHPLCYKDSKMLLDNTTTNAKNFGMSSIEVNHDLCIESEGYSGSGPQIEKTEFVEVSINGLRPTSSDSELKVNTIAPCSSILLTESTYNDQADVQIEITVSAPSRLTKEMNSITEDFDGAPSNLIPSRLTPVILKPKLCGRKLNNLPPIVKSHETSSLCCIV